MSRETYSLEDLLLVMARLRDPHSGCPWDLEQTFKTIVPSTLEECYELAYAIETDDYGHVAEELGDLLFQVVFYAQLGSEQKLFEFSEVVDILVAKLLRRHPHVFPDGEAPNGQKLSSAAQGGETPSIADVQLSWEHIKQNERNARSQSGLFDDVALALPALSRAQKIQKRAAGANLDWPDYRGAIAKVREELDELEAAIETRESGAIEEELGDLMFSCVNVSRLLSIDAESALRRATEKFQSRCEFMAAQASASGLQLSQMSSSALELLWTEAKQSVG